MTSQNLPMGRIGGHRGMDVVREDNPDPATAENRTIIRKQALHEMGNQGKPPPEGLFGVDLHGINVTAVHNEAVMLDEMAGSGYAPELIDVGDDWNTQEDLGHTEAPQDMEVWRQNLVRMLAAIRARGLRHGDLKGNNIITRENRPWAVDWQESHRIGDVAPQKSPYSDSSLLMQHIEGTYGPDGQLDTPRVARRWRAVLGSLGAVTTLGLPLNGLTFMDLGCFQGDFCALAASEGMSAVGVDRGGFRTGENSINIARQLWEGFPFGGLLFSEADIGLVPYDVDILMMFSTWPYFVQEYGRKPADDLLRAIIGSAKVFFFETQLHGDGPGPAFLARDQDVADMLASCGGTTVKAIGTFDVTGRPAKRTVWRVER